MKGQEKSRCEKKDFRAGWRRAADCGSQTGRTGLPSPWHGCDKKSFVRAALPSRAPDGMPGQWRDERTLHADGSSSSETGSPSVPVARAASRPSGAVSIDGIRITRSGASFGPRCFPPPTPSAPSAARALARSKTSIWAYLPNVSVPKPNFSLVGYTTRRFTLPIRQVADTVGPLL